MVVWLCLREICVKVEVTGLHTGSTKDPMPVGILNDGKGQGIATVFFD